MKEMMGFKEFAEAVAEGIREWLPEKFSNAEITLQSVTKNNELKLTGLLIHNAKSNMTPTIYLESFYESYKEGVCMDEIFEEIVQIRVENDMDEDFDVSVFTDLGKCKERIFPRVVGKEWNEELLAQRPHLLIEDLAVMFYVELPSPDGSMSAAISNRLMAQWNITVDELYEMAIANLENSNTGEFMSLCDMIYGYMMEDMEESEELKEMLDAPEPQLYVLTNRKRVHGASMLLNKKMMKEVTEKIGNEFFVLPSSIHECIIVPMADETNPSALEEMVREVNSTQVRLEERLSNHVYRYSAEKGLQLWQMSVPA